jgi:hypothetical protein
MRPSGSHPFFTPGAFDVGKAGTGLIQAAAQRQLLAENHMRRLDALE